eukprot:366490-Chlamydomonas_euryale.AAC.18
MEHVISKQPPDPSILLPPSTPGNSVTRSSFHLLCSKAIASAPLPRLYTSNTIAVLPAVHTQAGPHHPSGRAHGQGRGPVESACSCRYSGRHGCGDRERALVAGERCALPGQQT